MWECVWNKNLYRVNLQTKKATYSIEWHKNIHDTRVLIPSDATKRSGFHRFSTHHGRGPRRGRILLIKIEIKTNFNMKNWGFLLLPPCSTSFLGVSECLTFWLTGTCLCKLDRLSSVWIIRWATFSVVLLLPIPVKRDRVFWIALVQKVRLEHVSVEQVQRCVENWVLG